MERDSYEVKPKAHAHIEFWYANRLRGAFGNSFGLTMYRFDLTSKKSYLEWLAYSELAYFISPEFSWEARINLPLLQKYFYSNKYYSESHYKSWRGNTMELAARFWF